MGRRTESGRERAGVEVAGPGAAARGERAEADIVARAAPQVNRLTAWGGRSLRALCLVAVVAGGVVVGVAGCQPPPSAVPLQDPTLTGLEIGLVVAAEVLEEEGYALKPSLAKGKPRVETAWREEPERRRSVTVTLRDTPQGLVVATRLLTAVPADPAQDLPAEARIAFDGAPWRLIRPPSEDDSAEQQRLARRIQDRWKERMRALPPVQP